MCYVDSLALRNMHIYMSEKRGQFLPVDIFFYPAWSAMGTTYLLKDWWFLGIMGIAILDQIISLHSRTSCFWLKWLSTGFEGLLNISYKVLTIVYIVLIFSVICRKKRGILINCIMKFSSFIVQNLKILFDYWCWLDFIWLGRL